MKKLSSFQILTVLLGSIFLLTAEEAPPVIHSFKATNIDGKEVDFSSFKGKALLIVNVASQCGATPQYESLQAISEQYKNKGLVVLGFPSNDFGNQEPGTDLEIKNFCTTEYNVTFPMFAKVPVKGENKLELFKYLTSAANPDKVGEIGWNFEKFLVGKDGKLLRRFTTSVDPNDSKLLEAVEKAIAAN